MTDPFMDDPTELFNKPEPRNMEFPAEMPQAIKDALSQLIDKLPNANVVFVDQSQDEGRVAIDLGEYDMSTGKLIEFSGETLMAHAAKLLIPVFAAVEDKITEQSSTQQDIMTFLTTVGFSEEEAKGLFNDFLKITMDTLHEVFNPKAVERLVKETDLDEKTMFNNMMFFVSGYALGKEAREQGGVPQPPEES